MSFMAVSIPWSFCLLLLLKSILYSYITYFNNWIFCFVLDFETGFLKNLCNIAYPGIHCLEQAVQEHRDSQILGSGQCATTSRLVLAYSRTRCRCDPQNIHRPKSHAHHKEDKNLVNLALCLIVSLTHDKTIRIRYTLFY